MLKESATGIRVQSCEGDKIIVRGKKRKEGGKTEKLEDLKGKKKTRKLVALNI